MQTSSLEIKEKSVSELSWDFKIPPKSRIVRNMSEIAGGGGFIFSDLRFTSGLLADTFHELMFAIYPNQVNVFMMIPARTPSKRFQLAPKGKLELFSKDISKGVSEITFTLDQHTNSPPNNLFSAKWSNREGIWDDSVDLMKVTFAVEVEERGHVISYVSEDITEKLRSHPPPLELNATDLYLSSELSDIVFTCDEEEIPAHRFLLACKSPVFRQMFKHEMKETKEGKIVIEDMSAEVLKEVIRFLYCGKVENMANLSPELYAAADKYQLEILKSKCELHLVQNISITNALDMFVLGDTYGGKVLKEKAEELIKKRKREVIADAQTLKDFTQRFPELIFDLYQLPA